jgi:hypothetical protein
MAAYVPTVFQHSKVQARLSGTPACGNPEFQHRVRLQAGWIFDNPAESIN